MGFCCISVPSIANIFCILSDSRGQVSNARNKSDSLHSTKHNIKYRFRQAKSNKRFAANWTTYCQHIIVSASFFLHLVLFLTKVTGSYTEQSPTVA